MKTLGDLVSLQRGHDLPEQERRAGTVPVIGSAGLTGFHDTPKAKGPGVTLGRSGASFGHVTFVKEDFWPHNATLYVTDFKGNDVRYISYLLESIDFSSLNSGSAQQSLNRNYLYGIPVAHHPPATQRRIAGILSAYDDLIENCERRIKVLDEMARALYREWFVDFRYPGASAQTRASELPLGWSRRTLGETCLLVMGQSPRSEFYNETGDGLPFHQGVTNFGARYPEDRVFCTADARTAEAGDILFSVRAPVGRMNLANKRIALGRGVSAIRHNENHQSFLWEALRAHFTEEDMIGNGAIFAAVTKKDMEGIPLLCPPSSVVAAFTRVVDPINELVAVLDRQVKALLAARDLLLPRLLSGQLAVGEAE